MRAASAPLSAAARERRELVLHWWFTPVSGVGLLRSRRLYHTPDLVRDGDRDVGLPAGLDGPSPLAILIGNTYSYSSLGRTSSSCGS